jgi:hypothetical protein
VHDKQSGDEPFLRSLVLILRGAYDEGTSSRRGEYGAASDRKRNAALNAAAVTVARRLADSPSVRALGWKDALRELTSPSVTRRLASRDHTPAE